ncbi:MAG: chorismate mutase [Treponema sp.]|nr:chorismate mutase [Treponema sp.]
MRERVIKALRGAVRAANNKEDIAAAAVQLYDELLRLNGLAEGDLVSLFFSVTGDLDALNPATALRRAGKAGDLAMMVLREAAVEGTPPGIIRVLAHCVMDRETPVRHAYFRGAEILRPDRAAGA